MTNTRWGRRRPWLVLSAAPLCISYWFLWQVVPGNQLTDFVYYLFWLILLNLSFTCLSVPHLSLIPEMTNIEKEQTQLTSYKIVTLVVAALVGTTVHGIILELFSNQRFAYFLSASIFASVFLFPPLITAYFCKETAGQARTIGKQPSFVAGLKLAFQNRAFLLLCGAFLGAYMATQFLITNFYLYVQFVLDAESQVIFIIFLLQLTVAISCPVWGFLTEKVGKKPVYFVGAILAAACTLVLTFLFPSVVWLAYPGAVLLGASISAIFLVPFAMVPEIIDRDEAKCGSRREGVYYGLFIFLQKLATSVGLALGSALLGIVGFDADADEANTGVQIVLRGMVGLLPCILLVASLVPMYVYPFGKKGGSRGPVLKEESGDYSLMVDVPEVDEEVVVDGSAKRHSDGGLVLE
eukprot:CAMPEP_0114623538 /NCGR_PEP_ID=MMETSP0168-20121206/10305_1 /TAXON_ID=95228 ORGANISM="Vannella sp., Strain DIVA3 517/6/12" /NCGR_SAMPLE_ID=MMETSP0168 /ASSEMBLY_ACC=CAM_ASM_000044 /LENGTH=408 /DNA_ID=CAMNT_0001834789 /DNA_START=128 /DNA_END=1354 /DNA_ORIENTATION=-